MMGTNNRQYIVSSGSYGNVGHNPTQQSFVNIDPLLTLATDTGDTSPSNWCPTWNEPVDMFDVAFSEPLMPVAFSTAQSFSGGNELAPGVVPIEPLMIVSPASITISDATEHASSPPKARKPRQAKQQRQQQRAQNKGQGSRRPSQEPLQTSRAVKAEVEVQDGEDDEVETEGDEETTRDQFLARNRLAASKSRRRKREWEKNLEARKLEAEQRNLNLKMERALLIENDANIDKWLQNRAYRLANNPKEQHDGLPLGDAVLSYNT